VPIAAYPKHVHWVLAALLACSRVEPQPASPPTERHGEKVELSAHATADSPPLAATSSPLDRPVDRPPLTEPYPRGRWRLARNDDLAAVVLWVSHILVRHRDVPAGLLSFELPDWTAAPPAPERTREAAFAIAKELASRASAAPERFDELAREASEDIATRDLGGSLGAYGALRLSAWRRVLDAIAALEPGQTSRVVETPFGFHVFERRPPPPEMRVSASRIVIGHDDAPWLQKHLARGTVPRRSRADALALANDIYRQALAAPDGFSRLVHEYSEHKDSIRAGDFGEWSTRELTPFRQALEIASQLDVGGIAQPVDSLFGYQIIQRTKDRPRFAYRMKSVIVPFENSVPDDDPRSRASASSTLSALAEVIRSERSTFGEFQQQFCCVEARSWTEGRGSPLIEQALSRLEPGEISKQIVEDEKSFWLVQRLEAQTAPPPLVRFELPAPEHADVEYLVVRAHWARQLEEAGKVAAPLLNLDANQTSRFTALHDIAGVLKAAPFEAERRAIYRRLQRQLEDLLGPDAYARYATIVESHYREKLIGDSAPF
jgi:NIMA-interacting peptidyl-prolyl cis-trans isomerase 1